jgi:Ca2+-binding RTX toxin-like protein
MEEGEEKMRKIAMMLGLVMLAIFVAGGVALAATITGTDKDETLIGTAYADNMEAKGGDDEVRGLGGPDQLYGNEGRDEVVGGYGEDKLYGGNGNDRLRSQDIFSQSGAYRDVVDCGPGNDFAAVDFRDRVKDNCEDVSVAIP